MTVEAIGEVPQWTLGDRMGKALRESDIGVQGMADYLGVARTTVSTWLHDRIVPGRQTMILWALRTGVDFHWIEKGHEPGSGKCSECAARDSNPEPAGKGPRVLPFPSRLVA